MENTNITWLGPDENVDYQTALEQQERIVHGIIQGTQPQTAWLLSHNPVYTAGTSAKPQDLLQNFGAPVYATGRGGQYTWHGPGQRVVYVMLDLHHYGCDLRQYVHLLEEWIIQSLADFSIIGARREGRVGIWVEDPAHQTEHKIAAIGVRVRKWVSFHGIAINVCPDLSWYKGIVPCGISQFGVTSMQQLGVDASMAQLDARLKHHFHRIFKEERI